MATTVSELRERIDAGLRQAAGGGYDDRLNGLWAAAWSATLLGPQLSRSAARESRSTLLQILEMPLVGGCAPMCCNASAVRADSVRAKVAILQAWGKHDPDALAAASPEAVARLLHADSRRIAIAAAELLARSPGATSAHLPSVIAGLEHPRWQVVQAIVRALGRLPAPLPTEALSGLRRAEAHGHPEVSRAAEKALRVVAEAAARAQARAEKEAAEAAAERAAQGGAPLEGGEE